MTQCYNSPKGSSSWKQGYVSSNKTDLIDLYKGLEAYNTSYKNHNRYRGKKIYVSGSSGLYCYSDSGTIPILFIPSLINRASILDINANDSLLLRLAKMRTVKPYLLTWDSPLQEELDFGITSYIYRHIIPAIRYIFEHEHKTVILAGYCMGGIFALICSLLAAEMINGIILIATPWNFHSPSSKYDVSGVNPSHILQFQALPYIPHQLINLGFYHLNSSKVHSKFIDISKQGAVTERFTAIEDWANDGIDMTTPVFCETYYEWLYCNKLYNSKYNVAGYNIDLQYLKAPVLNITAENDDITPHDMSDFKIKVDDYNVKGGHIGMIIKRKYHLEQAITDWCTYKYNAS